jgi:tetratricopeptide (TPR) repeat protein
MTHARQPLSLLLHHAVYLLTAGFFQPGHRAPADVAFDTVALGSALAGAMFVPVALGLAREMAAPTTGPQPRAVPLLAALVLLTQGYVQLLFGYVENYTYFTLAMGVYLWTGLRFLRGRSPLLLPGVALVVAVGLNLSGLVLVPSYLAIAGWGLLQPSLRRSIVRDLAGTAVVCAALAFTLAAQGETGQVTAGLMQIWGLAFGGGSGGAPGSALLSREHLRDFVDIHFLIGPCGAFLAVPAAAHRLSRGNPRDARLWFLLLCAVPPLVASWLFGDPLQGFPRDWDLFAPFALLYAAAAVYCILSEPLASSRAPLLLAAIVAVSLFHTAPWIALNTSPARSLERYKTLPISRGRGQFTVGCWYLSHGQQKEAIEWFWRSVAAYGGNNAAHYCLGLHAMDEGRFEEAARHFQVCTDVRPDKADYRFALADALVMLDDPADAARQLTLATQLEPRDARAWACLGVTLSGIGRAEDARRALGQALELAPGDTLYARLLDGVGRADSYAHAVQQDWRTLVTR